MDNSAAHAPTLDHLPVAAFQFDRSLSRAYVTPRMAELTGSPRGWCEVDDLVAAGARAFWSRIVQRARELAPTGRTCAFDVPLHRGAAVRSISVHLSAGSPARGWAFVSGIAVEAAPAPPAARTAVRGAAPEVRAFLENLPDVAWIKDEAGRYVWVNRAAEQRFGFSDKAWLGRTDQDLWPGEYASRCRQAELRVLEHGLPRQSREAASPLPGESAHWNMLRFAFRDEAGRRYVGGLAGDISAHHVAEEEVRALAEMDELTGLCNRRGFLTRAAAAYAVAIRQQAPCVLFFADVDGLKRINDDQGHERGDALLRDAAKLLREAFRATDIVARMGGDEFAVFAADCPEPDPLVARLHEAIALAAEDGSAGLSMSVGYSCVAGSDPRPLQALLSAADKQMYERKRQRAAAVRS